MTLSKWSVKQVKALLQFLFSLSIFWMFVAAKSAAYSIIAATTQNRQRSIQRIRAVALVLGLGDLTDTSFKVLTENDIRFKQIFGFFVNQLFTELLLTGAQKKSKQNRHPSRISFRWDQKTYLKMKQFTKGFSLRNNHDIQQFLFTQEARTKIVAGKIDSLRYLSVFLTNLMVILGNCIWQKQYPRGLVAIPNSKEAVQSKLPPFIFVSSLSCVHHWKSTLNQLSMCNGLNFSSHTLNPETLC